MGNNYVFFGTRPLVCVVYTKVLNSFAWVYDESGTSSVPLIYRFILMFSILARLAAHPLCLPLVFFSLMQMVLVVRGEVTAM